MPNPFLNTQLQLTECGCTTINPSWHNLATFFPYYRIYYVTAGKAKMYMFDDRLDLVPGRLYFIPAFSITDAECEDTMSHYWMHFNIDITTASYLTVYKPALSIKAEETDEDIFKLIHKRFTSASDGSISDSLACVSLCKYLLSRFLAKSVPPPETSDFIPVLEYIDKHLSTKISNADLCAVMHLNETYFSNIFTKRFKISPKQYVLQKRIGAAANMLIETDKSVKEIAFYFGYENEMYFNRIFRKFAGMPPGEYRKKFRGKQ